jgi:hypothetical protein
MDDDARPRRLSRPSASRPGGRVTAGDTAITWPDVPAGQADAVIAAGQLVTASGGGSALSFLTVGTNGEQPGKITVTYTDDSTPRRR